MCVRTASVLIVFSSHWWWKEVITLTERSVSTNFLGQIVSKAETLNANIHAGMNYIFALSIKTSFLILLAIAKQRIMLQKKRYYYISIK